MTIPPLTSLKSPRQTASGSVILPPGEVHVWRAHLDVGPATLLRFRETVHDQDTTLAGHFHNGNA